MSLNYYCSKYSWNSEFSKLAQSNEEKTNTNTLVIMFRLNVCSCITAIDIYFVKYIKKIVILLNVFNSNQRTDLTFHLHYLCIDFIARNVFTIM